MKMNLPQYEADQLLIRIANAHASEDPNNQPAADRHCHALYVFLKDNAVTPDWTREPAATEYFRQYVTRMGRRA